MRGIWSPHHTHHETGLGGVPQSSQNGYEGQTTEATLHQQKAPFVSIVCKGPPFLYESPELWHPTDGL